MLRARFVLPVSCVLLVACGDVPPPMTAGDVTLPDVMMDASRPEVSAVDAAVDVMQRADAPRDLGPAMQRSCMSDATPGCGFSDVPGGTFTMGELSTAGNASPPQPMVTVSPFLLDTYEVTVARFRRYWEAGHPDVPSRVVRYRGNPLFPITFSRQGPAERDLMAAAPNDWMRLCNWTRTPGALEGHPMNCIDWSTAQAFCVWDGGRLPTDEGTGRLPTEAEWEFAARGEDGRKFPWDPPAPVGMQVCWNPCRVYPTDCPGSCPEEDERFAAGASPFGVRHMVGNVWEWAADSYSNYELVGRVDPCAHRAGMTDGVCSIATTLERTIRGGSWDYNRKTNLRSASRGSILDFSRAYYIGFRCARDGS